MRAFAFFLGGPFTALGSAAPSNSQRVFPRRYPPIEVPIGVNRPPLAQPFLNGYDFARRSIPSLIGCSPDVAEHHLARLPSAGRAWIAAGTIKNVFLATALNRRYDASTVVVGSKRDHVSGKALRTFNAMSRTRHKALKKAGTPTLCAYPASHFQVVRHNTHLTTFQHDHYHPPQ